MKEKSPEQQLDGFVAKFTPAVGAVAHAALAKMRALLPGAIELVYDNYNALAIGFGPTERASEILFSIALYPRWVSIFFMGGVDFPDPQKLLKGTGKGVRHIVLKDAATLDEPGVQALIRYGIRKNPKPLDPAVANRIVIKSISAKQRPRRPK